MEQGRLCLENRQLSLSEPLEGPGGWEQSVNYYGGWEEVGTLMRDCPVTGIWESGLRDRGPGTTTHREQDLTRDLPSCHRLSINGHLVLVSVSGSHTGV